MSKWHKGAQSVECKCDARFTCGFCLNGRIPYNRKPYGPEQPTEAEWAELLLKFDPSGDTRTAD